MWSSSDPYTEASWHGLIDAAAPRGMRLPLLPAYARGGSPNLAHWHVVQQVMRAANRWFGSRVRVDKDRHHRGHPISKRRPDLQLYNTRRHRTTHVEVDTQRAAMNAHMRDHLAREPNRRGVFLLIDPTSGAVIERHVIPAGSLRPMSTYGSPAQPVQLRPGDLFDAFEAQE